MFKFTLTLFALVACGVEPVDVEPDAGVYPDAPTPVCCALLPDIAAVRACVIAEPDAPPSGTCGRYVCPLDDGGRETINFCIP